MSRYINIFYRNYIKNEDIVKFLKYPNIFISSSGNRIRFYGEMTKEIWRDFCLVGDITRISNTNYSPKNQIEDDILRGSIWMVNFSDSMGAEIGGTHPCIVVGKCKTNNTYKVIPCTEHERGDECTYRFKISYQTMENVYDKKFVDDSVRKNLSTYVLLDQEHTIDPMRFMWHIGDLCAKQKRIITKEYRDYSLRYIKASTITVDNLLLSEKQLKMMEKLNDAKDDVLKIANSYESYFQKVHKIFEAFGIYREDNEMGFQCLYELCYNICKKIKLDYTEEIHKLAMSYQKKEVKIRESINSIMENKFPELTPCLWEFVSLINKLAY